MSIKLEQTTAEPVPTGEYAARIIEVTSETGQYGAQLKFKFELLAPEEIMGRTLIGWASQSFNVKSKLYGWARSAVFGGSEIPRDYILDTDEFIGKTAKIVVVVKRRDDGSEFSRIEDVKPLRKNSGKTVVPAPAPADQAQWDTP